MESRPPRRPGADREELPEHLKARLLERASELDASRFGTTIEDLRAAATEAGISRRAFEAALAEMQVEANLAAASPPPSPTAVALRRRGILGKFLAGVGVAAIAIVYLSSRVIPNRVPPAVDAYVEQAVVLSCLTPREAADLVRPLLRDPANQVVAPPDAASRVLRITATSQQHREVRRLLDAQQAPGSAACRVPPVDRPAPGPR